MSKSHRRSQVKGKVAQSTESMEATAQHPASETPARLADPGLAIMMQLSRIALGLGNLRVQVAAVELPPETRPSVADDLPRIAEALGQAQEELDGFLINLIDDLTGVASLDEPRRKQLEQPTPRRLARMRDVVCELMQDASTLPLPEDMRDEGDELRKQLYEVNGWLNEIKALLAEGGDA